MELHFAELVQTRPCVAVHRQRTAIQDDDLHGSSASQEVLGKWVQNRSGQVSLQPFKNIDYTRREAENE